MTSGRQCILVRLNCYSQGSQRRVTSLITSVVLPGVMLVSGRWKRAVFAPSCIMVVLIKPQKT